MRLDPRVIEEIAKEEPEYAAQLAREYRKAMIVLAREDPSWFCAYVLRNATDGSQIYQHSDHEALHRAILDCPRVAIWTHPGLGKALPLDTEVPTPQGWKLLCDLRVGDSVFSSKGTPCTVRALTPVQTERTVYRLTFDDKSSCLADAEHSWLVSDIWSRHEHRAPFVRTTAQLLEKPLKQNGKRTWAVPIAAATEYPEADLPVPPYAFGAWLGDGTSTSTQITFHGDDCAVYERCIALTGAPDTRKPISGREHLFRGYIGGLDTLHALRALGVSAPQGRKHIPAVYKTASTEQRMELLRGLMDTDGYVSKQSGMMEFCNTNQALAEDLLELVRSLGIKAKLSSKSAKCNGKVTGTAYYVHFSTRKPVFFLARKAAKLAEYEDARSTGNWKYITSIESVESVPVRCIEVDSDDHSFLVSRAYTVTHNCVTRDAKVLYADGTWREAGDLQAGDQLLTWSPEKHALIPVTASLIDNGRHPILHIKTADGAVLKVTENHPLLRSDLAWVRADQLEVGEEVVALNHLDLEGTTADEQLPPEEAEILGYLYAGRIGKRESVIIRRINGSEKWTARRQKMLESAGWRVVPYKAHAFQVKNTKKAAMSPALFLASLAKIEQGWPVDFLPEVYQLKTGSICRLLTAFFSAAYFRLHTTGDLNRNSAIAGTFGVADTRLPLYVGHTNRNTLESVRRLNLRTGAKLSLRVAGRGQPLKGTHGGIFPPMRARTARVNRHYKLYVLPEDLGRFWPTQQVPETPPALLKKVRILSITKSVKPVQTWGIEIAEKEHSYIQEGLVVHNTNQIAIGHVLWRIGKNPNCSIAMVCNTSEMAERTVSAIKQYIAYSQEFKDVFPNVTPGEVWSGTKFTVSRETIRRDPTLQAVGLTGNIVGARLDGLVLDDVDNIDSTLTEAARDQTEQRIRKQVISRLDAAGWAVAIGNVWHEKDLMHRLVKSGWKALKFPVLKYDDESGELISRDPSMFPMERIYQIRDFDQGPVEFERLYMLKARIDGEQRFKQEWIDQALELGKQQILMRQGVPKIPTGCRTVTGVDLGVKPKAKNDPTVITTILEVPKSGNQYDYQILNIVKGRWNAQEIMDKIKEQQRLFMSEVWVESNGCFVPGTRILTPAGYKPIETVAPGDLVWTHMGRWRKVLERYDGTARHVTPVRAKGNLPVTCTPNHAFYVRKAGRTPGRGKGHHRPVEPKGWCSAGFPDVPLYLNIAVPQWPDSKPVLQFAATQKLPARTLEVDESLALVLGLFMAEGHSTGAQVFWTFNKSEGYLADLLDRVLAPLGFKLTRRFGNGTLRVYLTQKQFGAVLKLGTGANKTLPLEWLGWPLQLRLALVRGWLLGDGSVGKNGDRKKVASRHLCGSTVSRHWALFVRTTLHQAGIPTALQEKTARTSVIAGRTLHTSPQFCINLSQKGSEALRAYMSDPAEATRWSAAWWDQPMPHSKVVNSSLILQEDGAWARQAAFDPEPSKTFIPYENGPVHNLVVEEDHSFTAEDYVVHNAQDFLIQLMNMSGLNYKINAFRTGMNKYDPMFGVEAIAAEMALNKWYIPSWDGTREGCEEEVDELIEEMLSYQPSNHTGDLLMSLWIARDGARQSREKSQGKVQYGRLRLGRNR